MAAVLRNFLRPPTSALVADRPFKLTWPPRRLSGCDSTSRRSLVARQWRGDLARFSRLVMAFLAGSLLLQEETWRQAGCAHETSDQYIRAVAETPVPARLTRPGAGMRDKRGATVACSWPRQHGLR